MSMHKNARLTPLGRVLLPSGLMVAEAWVLVGFHDILLPFDYPDHWKKRNYNEQYLLASVLLANREYFDLQLCNHWIWPQSMHVEPLRDIWSIVVEKARDREARRFGRSSDRRMPSRVVRRSSVGKGGYVC